MIVVLTGAGVSAESGIPTFRGTDGLWRNMRPEEIATLQAFEKNPKLVWEFYNWRREIISKAEPNMAHIYIKKIEDEFPDFILITQNVDGLHQKAGSKKIVELHGNIWKVRCTLCNIEKMDLRVPIPIPPICDCGGIMRPAVVWFGESLGENELQIAFSSSQKAEIFIVVGTSGVVYPAAQLPFIAKRYGAKIIEVNPDETPISQISSIVIRERATEGMKKVYEYLKKIKKE